MIARSPVALSTRCVPRWLTDVVVIVRIFPWVLAHCALFIHHVGVPVWRFLMAVASMTFACHPLFSYVGKRFWHVAITPTYFPAT